MRVFRDAFSIIHRHQRAFLVLNVAFYGLFLLCMLLTLFVPELQNVVKPDIDKAYSDPGLFKAVGEMYASKNLVLAIALTFVVNLAVAVGMTTIPSFVVPFVGIAAVLHRAMLWGVMFAPIGPLAVTLVPHSLTLFIEGQAYVLAGFAAYVHGRTFVWPHGEGLRSRWEGYKAGALSTARLYPLVVTALLVGAIYEVFESIYLMPLLLAR